MADLDKAMLGEVRVWDDIAWHWALDPLALEEGDCCPRQLSARLDLLLSRPTAVYSYGERGSPIGRLHLEVGLAIVVEERRADEEAGGLGVVPGAVEAEAVEVGHPHQRVPDLAQQRRPHQPR